MSNNQNYQAVTELGPSCAILHPEWHLNFKKIAMSFSEQSWHSLTLIINQICYKKKKKSTLFPKAFEQMKTTKP